MRVDALPAIMFHPAYNDGMWRRHRHSHLKVINQLLPTVEMMSSELLQELGRLAITYDRAVVREAILDLFSRVATDEASAEEFGSAALFFDGLIEDVSRGAPELSFKDDARELMMQWPIVTDPLRIAEDSECGYGMPGGLVN
jgi:hypothetical protein